MKKILATTAITAMLVSSAAVAQQNRMALEDVDSDASGMISMDEYNAGLTADRDRRFATYDTNEDGNITADEFAAGEFNRYDEDRDAELSDAEYASYTEDDDRFETED